MWVFGYGSLMWDGWEKRRGCSRRLLASLQGYCRVFNKASICNWGTKAAPCPTLNLKQGDFAVCVGVAFEFPAEKATEITGYLKEREGAGFTLTQLAVRLETGEEVRAFVPLYRGPNVLREMTAADLAATIKRATGTSGTCESYLRGIAGHLAALSIDDVAVAELIGALDAA